MDWMDWMDLRVFGGIEHLTVLINIKVFHFPASVPHRILSTTAAVRPAFRRRSYSFTQIARQNTWCCTNFLSDPGIPGVRSIGPSLSN